MNIHQNTPELKTNYEHSYCVAKCTTISQTSLKDNSETECLKLSLMSIRSNKNCAAAILLSSPTSSQYFLTILSIYNERPNTSHNLNLYRSQQNCKLLPSRDWPHSNNTHCHAIKLTKASEKTTKQSKQERSKTESSILHNSHT